ncbi:cystathionine beta-lyase [Marinicauda algicola]|uniref:Cystathionine beta-lyase n=1 Tax=Marinicauda algicola TaxID=2029849 RepID=A0A4S2GXT8_9PROT|nr:cystathionine beta-lyase [Marinicauda algicola]TGY87955.1 cystathionine beta-lyase [Marinicauda algicola]
MKRDTRLIHAGRPARAAGPVNAPVERASTVLAASSAELYAPSQGQRTYARGGLSPNTALTEALEGLYGADGVSLAPSGLAGVVLAIRSAIEEPGDALIVDSVYKPVRRFCDEELPRLGVTPRYYDPRAGAGIADLIGEETRMILLESPGSLTFEVQDVPAIAKAAKARGVATVIDDTWSAGYLMNPLDLGVDYAAQSLTKYVGGHSDLLMGCVAARGENARRVAAHAQLYGAHVSPDDAFMALRGLRTLSVRLERCGRSGLDLARRLEAHPAVARVLHPALESSPDNALFKKQFSAPAGCFSVVLKDRGPREGEAVADALELFGLGFSWGGYESLVLPCDRQLVRTAVPWRERGALLRFSIGLEDVEDLWADLERALGA